MRVREKPLSRVDKRMLAYTLAAGAGLAAAPALSDASVIYTNPSDTTITHGSSNGAPQTILINLDNTGGSEFTVEASGKAQSQGGGSTLTGEAKIDVHDGSTDVIGTGVLASALNVGATIGPAQTFLDANGQGLLMARGFYSSTVTDATSGTEGNWVTATQLFLGVTFQIAGEAHFGWARLTVSASAFSGESGEEPTAGGATASATLLDYAYESCAREAITAGATTGGASCGPGSDPVPVPMPASLGLLALGAGGLGLWRFRKS